MSIRQWSKDLKHLISGNGLPELQGWHLYIWKSCFGPQTLFRKKKIVRFFGKWLTAFLHLQFNIKLARLEEKEKWNLFFIDIYGAIIPNGVTV